MGTLDRSVTLAFALLFALIIAVYYIGVTTDADHFASAFVSIGNMLTGRNAQGNFPNKYPKA